MWRHTKMLQEISKNYPKVVHMCTQTTKISVDIKDMVKPVENDSRIEPATTKNYLHIPGSNTKETHSFEEIPGPVSLRTLSKFWHLVPMMGTETVTRILRYFLEKDSLKDPSKLYFRRVFDHYGPIVKLHGIFGNDIVLLCKPEHASIALSCEKPFYTRSYFDSVEKYRKDWRKYTRSGPFLKIDDDWEDLRATIHVSEISVNPTPDMNDILSDQFIKKIPECKNNQEELTDGWQIELYKWSLESLSLALFDKEFGFLTLGFISPNSDPGRLLDGLLGATEALRKLESGFHYWKFTDTPKFHALIKYCNLIDGILSKYVSKAMKSLRQRKDGELAIKDPSLVENLLLKTNLGEEDIMTILLDNFLISTNSACHTITLLLLHLAKNPRSQIKLQEEIVAKGEVVTTHNIDKREYLNACIKECLRLDPPIPIVGRQLENDIVLNHYRIPKDTYIFYSTHLNSNREEYFEDAVRFKPERWLSGDLGEYGREYQSYATNTFGFGPDAKCIRDTMHLQIARLIVKIITKFKIEYVYGEMRGNIEFLAPNNKPIKLRFVNRVK